MSSLNTDILRAQQFLGIKCPIPVVDPVTKSPLDPNSADPDVADCVKNFKFVDGFPDLIVGDRFEDKTDDECLQYEEHSNSDLTKNYWLPLINKLFRKGSGEKRKLLSLGCGTGIDVDLLTDAGYETVGIEIGNRTRAWRKRKYPERFLLANGMHLPFPTETFDCVYCGCVFPHVGVVGDSDKVAGNYIEARAKLAAEMIRATKLNGKIIVSSPNRNFPVDLFHGRKLGSYKPRNNLHRNPALLSIEDYTRLFSSHGCSKATPLSTKNYWGFIRASKSLKGRLMSLPVRFLFNLNHDYPSFRGSFFDPWLVLLFNKES